MLRQRGNWFLVLVLLVFIASSGVAAFAEEKTAELKNKIDKTVQIKLPDGLYLLQAKINNETFSPLFIVENGKLVDPYVLAKKIGIQKFMKEYVTGKTFNIYDGTEMIGELSNVKLKFSEIDKYSDIRDPSFTDIIGKGVYKGNPLLNKSVDDSLYVRRNLLLPFVVMRKIAMPQSFQLSKKTTPFILTEKDKLKAVELVEKDYSYETAGVTKKPLKKIPDKYITKQSDGRLEFIKAIDIDGNGKKDFIGVYYSSVAFANEILFILWDTGKIEKILIGGEDKNDARSLIFILGGLIDIDQDEMNEVIVLTGVSRDSEFNDEKIKIMRHENTSWKNIFNSKRINRRSY